MKNVVVSEEFYINVMKLVTLLSDYDFKDGVNDLRLKIENYIVAKAAAADRREKFTAYKSAAAGSEAREAKRKDYLDAAGIKKDWRTESESNS